MTFYSIPPQDHRRKRVRVSLVILLLTLLSGWTHAREIPEGFVFEENIPYANISERQRLDILYPKDTALQLPAIIHIHGGGWYAGGKGGDRTFNFLSTFAKAGYVGLSIEYRLSDEAPFPAAIEDCKEAVRWLRSHSKEYGVDPDRIGAIGASAGGHLSAMLAVAGQEAGFDGDGTGVSSAIQAAAPVCAPLDLRAPLAPEMFEGDDPVVVRFLGGSLADKSEEARRASPIAYVRKDLPPMLFIHGTADRRVDISQSKNMVKALEQVGAPYETIWVEGGNHGMGIAREQPVLNQIVDFFDRALKPKQADQVESNATNAETLKWWRDAKFGLFIHWGPSSLTGEEISWARAGERPGLEDLLPGTIPVEEYDNLYKKFNPTEFNAREWIDIAQQAGMKYIVFTTKHHDGFCMFDSKLTDYDITQSPFQRDIVAEIAEACHEARFGLGFYYSLPDWRHPDYKTDHHEGYIEYLRGQVRELCENYGPVDILWFDGKRQGTPETWDSDNLIRMIRNLQPKILINDRVWGETDFHTPEQVIGRFEPDRPWESCITIGHQWSWKPNEQLKSWQECVRLLALVVGGGGNLLFNIGPMPSGAIEPRQVECLERIGDWLERYGESIYSTSAGPFEPSYWGASTHRDNSLYLHILKGWETDLELPPIERHILSYQNLTGGTAEVVQSSEVLRIKASPVDPEKPLTLLKLTLDGPASDIPYKGSNVGIPAGARAQGSNIRRGEEHYAPTKAVDDDPLSRWATDDGVTEAWLEIELPHSITFDAILIDEAFGPRVESFRLQFARKGNWETFYEGTTIGRNWAAKFDPVTAQRIRLEITQASDGPTLRDIRFHIVNPEP
ncbi:MAG: alpha-L-fucosidase [Candidatus Omnitrophica bacterium]|nr:alpha-L-fucosidase [Candidatus Omnitrophota bacterium]